MFLALLNDLKEYFFGPRGFAYTIFLMIGFVLLSLSLPNIIQANQEQVAYPIETKDGCPPTVIKIPQQTNPKYALALSVGTSLLILGLVEIGAKTLEILRKNRDLPLFTKFFGRNVFDGYKAIFLNARLPEFPQTSVANTSNLNNIKLVNPPKAANGTFPKGIDRIIPFEDIAAVLEIDRLLRSFGATLEICLDDYTREKPLPENGCLSIGLGYNNVTTRLSEISERLFTITYDHESDDFILGTTLKPILDPTKDTNNYALLARVLVPKGETEYVTHIICAGHTAPDTVVACRYLAKNWKDLAHLYTTDKHKFNEWSMGVILHTGTKELKLGSHHFVHPKSS